MLTNYVSCYGCRINLVIASKNKILQVHSATEAISKAIKNKVV